MRKTNKKINQSHEAGLTVMLPFPAGRLSFITSGLVTLLEETIWTKKNKNQKFETMNYTFRRNIKDELSNNKPGDRSPVPRYIPALPDSRLLADCRFHCRCHTFQTWASAPSQNSSQPKTFWRTWGSSSSWFSPFGQPEKKNKINKKIEDSVRFWSIQCIF